MRKSILLLTSAAVSLMLAFSACSGDSNDYPVSVSAVTLNKSELLLSVGSAETLKATLNPDNAADKELRWTSGDADIASVSGDGLVTAMAKGATSITVKTNDGGHRATCAVTVYTIPVTSFTLDTNSLTLFAGATHTFTKNILPENASDKGVIWTCSNDYVASVSNEGVVTALGSGAAIITAATRDGGYNASCALTVIDLGARASDLTLNKDWLFLEPGWTEKLTATIFPESVPDKTVTWSSSNPDIASVSSDGLITAIAKGTTQIVAKHSISANLTAVCSLGVAPPLDVPPVSGDVFVAGFAVNVDRNIRIAAFWKNGELQLLGENDIESEAYSIFVCRDDVYVAGQAGTQGIVWKNGVPVILTNQGFSDAMSVFASGGDVFVAGSQNKNMVVAGNIATVWKNGAPQRLGDGKNQTLAESIFVSGNDVYVAGNILYYDQYTRCAALWKNGVFQALSSAEKNRNNWGSSVSVSGNDVYVAGYESYNLGWTVVAKLWKNGQAINLTSTAIDVLACAFSCCVLGDDVYVAGYEYSADDNSDVATVWKNNEVYHRLIGDGYYHTAALSIFASGGDIYVAGRGVKGDITNATIWKNGVLCQEIPRAWNYSIFVVD